MSKAAIQALTGENIEFDFGHVQPTTVLGRVVEFQPLQNALGFCGSKRLIQGSRLVGVQVVWHDPNALSVRVVKVDQVFQTVGIIDLGSPIGHVDMAPTLQWLEEHEEIAGAMPFVFVIIAGRFARSHGQRHSRFTDQLHRQFVSAEVSCLRLPALALLAGNILTFLAVALLALPTGFWDRQPKKTPGRLRRLLAQINFSKEYGCAGQLRKKESVTDHLPKGVQAHRRHKAILLPI